MTRLAVGSRCGLKTFKMFAMAGTFDKDKIMHAILNLHVSLMSSINFQVNLTYDLGDVL